MSSVAFVWVIACAGLGDILCMSVCVCVCAFMCKHMCMEMSVCVRMWMHTNYVHHIHTYQHKSWICKTSFPEILAVHSTPKRCLHIPSLSLSTRYEHISDNFFRQGCYHCYPLATLLCVPGESRPKSEDPRATGPTHQLLFTALWLRQGWPKWLEMKLKNSRLVGV